MRPENEIIPDEDAGSGHWIWVPEVPEVVDRWLEYEHRLGSAQRGAFLAEWKPYFLSRHSDGVEESKLAGRQVFIFAAAHQWETTGWNPVPGGSEIQHAVPPQPTWQELVRFERGYRLELRLASRPREGRGPHSSLAELREDAKAHVGDAAVELGGVATHVGTGLEHMTGLMHLVEDGNLAGNHLPPVRLRDAQHAPRDVWLVSDVRALLGAVAERENRMESAHNVLVRKRTQNVAIAIDETATLDAREAAIAIVEDLDEHYAERLSAEMEMYDPEALPADVSTLREVYVERLEAFAMKRVKEIKGAKTQQGVDVPATCLDMASALEEVSQASALGVQAVNAATDTAAAKTAYDSAIATIEAVTPLNVPELFDAGGDEVTADIAVTQAAPVKLEAKHPAGVEIAGSVSVAVATPGYVVGAFTSITSELDGDGKFARTTIALSAPDVAGETARYEVTARNLCGPARTVLVAITRPQSGVEPLN